MERTGTNYVNDLWSDLQMIKHIITKPISDLSKKRLIERYDKYKANGGVQVDKEIERWRKEIK